MGATTVYVTHDQREAMPMGDQIVVLNQGVIDQQGEPQEIDDCLATMCVASCVGSDPMNVLESDDTDLIESRDRLYFDASDCRIP